MHNSPSTFTGEAENRTERCAFDFDFGSSAEEEREERIGEFGELFTVMTVTEVFVSSAVRSDLFLQHSMGTKLYREKPTSTMTSPIQESVSMGTTRTDPIISVEAKNRLQI
jgi:hypothetical protein